MEKKNMEKKKTQSGSGLVRGEMPMTADKNIKRMIAYFLVMILAADRSTQRILTAV